MDRRLWSPQEDEHIVRLVAKYGTKKWPLVSEKLCQETRFERTGKQCRERWHNHLDPEINNALWSEEDELRLFEAHKIHGNRWKCISRLLEGRTDNSIKNHFYSTIRRCLRRINKLQGEKNSTLKMRSLKPYVLSKILADRELTETILQLGKIKPNKKNRELNPEHFSAFNDMIAKLYQINADYEQVKNEKRAATGRQSRRRGRQQEEGEEEREEEGEEEGEEGEEMEIESPSSSEKGESCMSKLMENLQKQQSPKVGLDQLRRKIEQRQLQSQNPLQKPLFKSPKQPRKPKKPHKPLATPLPLQPCLPQPKQSSPNKRARRTINYLKLNEGILCEYERQEIEETNYSSNFSRKKIEQTGSCDLLEQRVEEEAELEEIEEEEEKSNEKEFGTHNLFGSDYLDMKSHLDICQPSPSYIKGAAFQDELIVIGTHLKIFPTPTHAAPAPRKQSEQDFIEQILQINFDPQLALREIPEEEQQF